MTKRALLAASLAASLVLAATPATVLAADPAAPGPVSGTIVLTAKSAAAGIGYTWGNGVLHFAGRNHHFTVKGVDIAAVGYSEVSGRGRVYGLKKSADFSGTYGAASGEATLVNGIGGQYLRNGNGVEIRIDNITKGAKLTGGADGIQLTLID